MLLLFFAPDFPARCAFVCHRKLAFAAVCVVTKNWRSKGQYTREPQEDLPQNFACKSFASCALYKDSHCQHQVPFFLFFFFDFSSCNVFSVGWSSRTVLEHAFDVEPVRRARLVVRTALQIVGEFARPRVVDHARVALTDRVCDERITQLPAHHL